MPIQLPGRPVPYDEIKGLLCCEPGCTGELVLRWSKMNSQWFYGCSRYPDCYGSLSANPDGSPRGAQKPRNFQKSSTEGPELENARRKATAAFASLKEHCTIKEACQWIRQATNLKRKQVFHPAQMNIEQCQQAIEAVKIKGPGTEFWELWKKSNLKKTLWDHLQEPDL